jgi:hypothetical protein
MRRKDLSEVPCLKVYILLNQNPKSLCLKVEFEHHLMWVLFVLCRRQIQRPSGCSPYLKTYIRRFTTPRFILRLNDARTLLGARWRLSTSVCGCLCTLYLDDVSTGTRVSEDFSLDGAITVPKTWRRFEQHLMLVRSMHRLTILASVWNIIVCVCVCVLWCGH